jgi:malonyl-CoA O-methyltransferase
MTDANTLDKSFVRRSFSKAARTYDDAAFLQREVDDRMAERLDYIKHQPRTILDVGAGTGHGSRKLIGRYPQAHLTALDLALPMLAASRQQAPWWKALFPGKPRVGHVCADLERLPLKSGQFDLVWSNLALQWANDPQAALDGFYRVLRPGGLLMFSTFGPDTLKELRQAFSGLDGYTHLSRFIDMHDIGDMLVRLGFENPVMDMEFITLTYPDLKGLMTELKAIGAHNATAGRRRGLMGRREWQSLEAAYEQFRREDRLPATYEILYGHAWKPVLERRKAADGSQVVSFVRK